MGAEPTGAGFSGADVRLNSDQDICEGDGAACFGQFVGRQPEDLRLIVLAPTKHNIRLRHRARTTT